MAADLRLLQLPRSVFHLSVEIDLLPIDEHGQKVDVVSSLRIGNLAIFSTRLDTMARLCATNPARTSSVRYAAIAAATLHSMAQTAAIRSPTQAVPSERSRAVAQHVASSALACRLPIYYCMSCRLPIYYCNAQLAPATECKVAQSLSVRASSRLCGS